MSTNELVDGVPIAGPLSDAGPVATATEPSGRDTSPSRRRVSRCAARRFAGCADGWPVTADIGMDDDESPDGTDEDDDEDDECEDDDR